MGLAQIYIIKRLPHIYTISAKIVDSLLRWYSLGVLDYAMPDFLLYFSVALSQVFSIGLKAQVPTCTFRLVYLE